MNIEELVNGLKEKGLDDNAIRQELEKIKNDIDNYLNPQAEVESPQPEEEEKEKRIFGL